MQGLGFRVHRLHDTSKLQKRSEHLSEKPILGPLVTLGRPRRDLLSRGPGG